MHCSQAEVVYDLFYVVAKLGREVMDRVRVGEANRLRGDRVARKVVKSSRWLLLRNWENVTRETYQIRPAGVPVQGLCRSDCGAYVGSALCTGTTMSTGTAASAT
ncbi:hypothetical protein CBM2634_U480006 [Cupriavidus taiwanensis]|uniref:Transposase IS204/IS1001/IS1096/IS1165 DDE domain-containing protein n=1 Tax=Cupriavidus taiwanensis TaxID=164546 RepID=A0A375JDA0_9BURK|nr:hypothetical protein CBM2634_U480006 [Cupriavidus taiwanensis]